MNTMPLLSSHPMILWVSKNHSKVYKVYAKRATLFFFSPSTPGETE